MTERKRRRRGSRSRARFGVLRPVLILLFLAGIVLFIIGFSHLHDSRVPRAGDYMVVGICLIVLAPITYVLRGGRGSA